MKGSSLKSVRGLTTVVLASAMLGITGCAAIQGSGGTYTKDKYLDAREPSKLNTSDIESSDVQTATHELVGKVLAHPAIAGSMTPPRVVVSSSHFENDTDRQFNVNALSDLVRNEIINASAGRVKVMYAPMDAGDPHEVIERAEADFAVGARITEVSARSGDLAEDYVQITFHVVDTHSNEIVLSDLYNFKKKGRSIAALY